MRLRVCIGMQILRLEPGTDCSHVLPTLVTLLHDLLTNTWSSETGAMVVLNRHMTVVALANMSQAVKHMVQTGRGVHHARLHTQLILLCSDVVHF